MSQAPLATYRVQLHPGFDFDAAAGIADYLAELGVSHLYCSPYLQSAPGSTHGYDVVDPTRINAELGGLAGCARLGEALRTHGLGQVVDVVANHMAIAPENPWWWDVLEDGPSSRYAAYFDVDWTPSGGQQAEKIMLPVLGDHYGRVLEAGELQLEREGGAFRLRYHEHRFPIAPGSLHRILRTAVERCDDDLLAFLNDTLAWLPVLSVGTGDPERRHRDKEVVRGQLARLLEESASCAAAVDAAVAQTNASFDALDGLIEAQHYRLAFWRTAGRALGYRRFFDINSLIGLRVEDERVFRDTHAQLLHWVAAGAVEGLRIDHPDGLRDPLAYFRRLRAAAPGAWIVVEKILEPGEPLRDDWPIDGTTGYGFLNEVGGLFVDGAADEAMTRCYADLAKAPTDYGPLVREKKRQVLRELLGSDVNRLTALLQAICEQHRRHRDYTREELLRTIEEVVACFPVYRTYVRAPDGPSDEDLRYVEAAIGQARAERPQTDPELLEFLRDILLLRRPGQLEGELAVRFQQLASSAMAKGAEDTAFYCYNRLVALNEVGGDPGRFGVSAEDFHRWAIDTQRRWPQAMLATSTHDTKRSEDVRARLALISEIPQQWAEAARRWSAMAERHRRDGMPDRNTEYLLYQTLVGAWPIERERLLAYMEKAVREAKVHTSWLRIDAGYESALKHFIESLLADAKLVEDLEAFVAPLVEPGRLSSLAQTLIKLTAPGVPDIYQGSELWDLSLVDPDNRRPVDYERRRRLLGRVAGMTPEAILAASDEGLPKLWTIRQGLALRRSRPDAFGAQAGYRPLAGQGSRAAHLVAFVRGEDRVATVVPRLTLGLNGDWDDTELELPAGDWHNALTGETLAGGMVRVERLLRRFPVAVLARGGEP